MRSLIPLLSLSFPILCFAETFWLEKPSSTNFPDSANWEILSEEKAPAVMNVRDPTRSESFFIEYQVRVPQGGGDYKIWGRSYDPNWSSPARWRIDEEEWQEWRPKKAFDRKIFRGTFVVQWHPWTEDPIHLTEGVHRLRLELTGPRKRGDIPFFVLDVLVFTNEEFIPDGSHKPHGAITP